MSVGQAALCLCILGVPVSTGCPEPRLYPEPDEAIRYIKEGVSFYVQSE